MQSSGLAVALGAILATIAPACAGDASRYTLNLTGQGVGFTPTMNGLPVGPPFNPAESLAYSVDAFMHNGANQLAVSIDRQGTAGAAGVIMLGPAGGALGFGAAPRLAELACNPAAGGGVPACKPHQVLDATIKRTDAPDLRLWHAAPVPAGTDVAAGIAAALARLTGELAAAARAQDWSRLYYLTDLRRADMERANPDSGQDEAAAAAAMQAVLRGKLATMPPPGAALLRVTALPGSLWSVTRTDGAALLRIAAAGAAHAPDPERFGDLTERWSTGAIEIRVAVFGLFDGRWQLAR